VTQNLDQSQPTEPQHQTAPLDLRQRAEAAGASQASSGAAEQAALTPAAAAALIHELRMHQIQLQMQNDELRRSEHALALARESYFDLYELAPVGYCTVSESGLILQANLSAAKLLGSARNLLIKRRISQFIFAADQDLFYLLRRALLDTAAPQTLELRMLNTAEAALWVQLHATVSEEDEVQNERRNSRRRVLRIVISDISKRKLAEQALQDSQQVLLQAALHTQTILDNVGDAVITISTTGLVETFNKAAAQMFGHTESEVLGRNVKQLMPEPHRTLHDRYLSTYLATGRTHVMGAPRDLEACRKDGRLFPIRLTVSKVDSGGRITFIGLMRDMTQDKRQLEAVHRLAFYDPLTGLPNRRLLMDRLKQALLNSARSAAHGSLMFLDLDHFKQLNDSLGHDIGDLLLAQVAQRIQTCVRECDSLARLGGDEFVILLEGLSVQATEAAAEAEEIAAKILKALRAPYRLDKHDYTSTPSIGIVLFLDSLEPVETLLKKADLAMYQAKAAGRNAARFFDSAMQAAAFARAELEQELRQGLIAYQFVLHYQIQVGDDGLTQGAEALVRWNHPRLGLVQPSQFIPLAEETGMILPLGQWVLEAACAQLRVWSKKPATAHWTLSVNVSACQFAKPDFVASVAAALAHSSVPPNRLKLELTEGTLVGDVADVTAKMEALKVFGVDLSLDDFGTGFSSLSQLKRLPLAQLKIDKSFVRDVLTSPSDAMIARTILALGHNLGLTVIAEGVETADQHEALARMGCNAFQGFYFSRPVPPDQLINFSANADRPWLVTNVV
jgi:diguanylate cyclase (GGDEF)-like protein/PAS domain S-box-containing protein